MHGTDFFIHLSHPITSTALRKSLQEQDQALNGLPAPYGQYTQTTVTEIYI